MKSRFKRGFQKKKKKKKAIGGRQLRNLDLPKIIQFFVSARPTSAVLESSSQLEVGLLPDTSNIAAVDRDDSRDSSSPDKL